jgi:hypothetical protein
MSIQLGDGDLKTNNISMNKLGRKGGHQTPKNTGKNEEQFEEW